MASNREATGLTALRLFLGVYCLCEGLGKFGWFLHSDSFARLLAEWSQQANAWNGPYIREVLIPGKDIFARLAVIGELGTGIGFLLGVFTRPIAALALLAVFNFLFASGAIFRVGFLTNPGGLPVLGGMLALAIGAGRLPWSLRS